MKQYIHCFLLLILCIPRIFIKEHIYIEVCGIANTNNILWDCYTNILKIAKHRHIQRPSKTFRVLRGGGAQWINVEGGQPRLGNFQIMHFLHWLRGQSDMLLYQEHFYKWEISLKNLERVEVQLWMDNNNNKLHFDWTKYLVYYAKG